MASLRSHGPIFVAGGGIGGLTLARALEVAGFEARVFERTPELREVGAGITVQANAMLALRHLGLEEPVLEAGQVVSEVTLRTRSGRDLGTASMEAAHRELGARSVILHRARLQEILARSLERTRPELGRTLVAVRSGPSAVTVKLEGGEEVSGPALVGCDGRSSRVREVVFDDGPLRYSGYTTWRGVTPGEPATPPGSATEIWAGDRRFGLVPMGPDELYWYASKNAAAGGEDPPGEVKAHLRRLFADLPPPVDAVLAATPEGRIVRTDVFDRPPSASWYRDRVALLGDAMHPMEPNLGQGGCQAIEDAVVLADALAGCESFAAAFADYQARRSARVAWFVDNSRMWGSLTQRLPRLLHPLRNLTMQLTPTAAITRSVTRMQRFALGER